MADQKRKNQVRSLLIAGGMAALLMCTSCGNAVPSGEQDKTAYRELGILQMQQEDYENAVISFRTSLDLIGFHPDLEDYDTLRWLGEAYYRLGEFELSLDVCERLAELGKLSDTDAEWVNDLAVRLLQEKDFVRAENILKKGSEQISSEMAGDISHNLEIVSTYLKAHPEDVGSEQETDRTETDETEADLTEADPTETKTDG